MNVVSLACAHALLGNTTHLHRYHRHRIPHALSINSTLLYSVKCRPRSSLATRRNNVDIVEIFLLVRISQAKSSYKARNSLNLV